MPGRRPRAPPSSALELRLCSSCAQCIPTLKTRMPHTRRLIGDLDHSAATWAFGEQAGRSQLRKRIQNQPLSRAFNCSRRQRRFRDEKLLLSGKVPLARSQAFLSEASTLNFL
jgi:hypothetical protein